MSDLAILWFIVVQLFVLAVFVVLEVRRRNVTPPRTGYRVTVHTKKPDDQTLFGVLVGDYKDRIVLEDAEYVSPTGSTSLPGRQHVATDQISWIDVHALVAPIIDEFHRHDRKPDFEMST